MFHKQKSRFLWTTKSDATQRNRYKKVPAARPDENPAYITADGGVELELGGHDSIEQNIVDYFTRLGNDSISFSGIEAYFRH